MGHAGNLFIPWVSALQGKCKRRDIVTLVPNWCHNRVLVDKWLKQRMAVLSGGLVLAHPEVPPPSAEAHRRHLRRMTEGLIY